MKSFLVALVATGSLVASASAQTYPDFDPQDVADATKKQWCVDQTAKCPLLCQDQGKSTIANKCYPDNLYYVCTCSDGTSPNLTEYSQTIPYFQCTTQVQNCIAECKGSSSCADTCKINRPCGATGPKRVNITTTTSSPSTTTSSGSRNTGGSDSGFAVTGADGAQATGTGNSGAGGKFVAIGSAYGLGMVVAGVVAGAMFIGL